MLGILQTPHRFRTKRQLWTYCGLGVVTSSSADHEVAKGQLRRKKKPAQIRGLNENCNHDLKNLFKGAAVVASIKPGPLGRVLCGSRVQRHAAGDGPADLGEKNCHHCFDRVEERSVLRRPVSETTNSLSVSDRTRSLARDFSGGCLWVLETLWFESESQPVS